MPNIGIGWLIDSFIASVIIGIHAIGHAIAIGISKAFIYLAVAVIVFAIANFGSTGVDGRIAPAGGILLLPHPPIIVSKA